MNIGEYFSSKRELLGLSIEQMSNKTKLTTLQIQALENNEISYFKDDLSYLPYIMRFYANALQLDFNDIRSDVDQLIINFEEDLRKAKLEKHKAIEKTAQMKKINAQPLYPISRKVDYSFLSLVALMIVLILSLVLVFFVYILPRISAIDNTDGQNPVVVLPIDPNENNENPTDPIDDDDQDPISVLSFYQVQPRSFAIIDFIDEQDVIITVDFNHRTWIRVYIDDVTTDNPKSKTYNPNERMEIRVKAQQDRVITIHFGYLKGNVIKINDEEVTLDPSIANITGGIKIDFRFIGE